MPGSPMSTIVMTPFESDARSKLVVHYFYGTLDTQALCRLKLLERPRITDFEPVSTTATISGSVVNVFMTKIFPSPEAINKQLRYRSCTNDLSPDAPARFLEWMTFPPNLPPAFRSVTIT